MKKALKIISKWMDRISMFLVYSMALVSIAVLIGLATNKLSATSIAANLSILYVIGGVIAMGLLGLLSALVDFLIYRR